MSRIGTVIRFEFTRAVKKPAFWIGTLALPLVVVLVSLLVGVGQAAGTDSALSRASATDSETSPDRST
jgi:ABC-2 type transport system permease protein